MTRRLQMFGLSWVLVVTAVTISWGGDGSLPMQHSVTVSSDMQSEQAAQTALATSSGQQPELCTIAADAWLVGLLNTGPLVMAQAVCICQKQPAGICEVTSSSCPSGLKAVCLPFGNSCSCNCRL